jgi:hypothetical protein
VIEFSAVRGTGLEGLREGGSGVCGRNVYECMKHQSVDV